MDTLADLVDTIIATEQYPTAWNWMADPNDADGPYIESGPSGEGSDRYCLEVRDEDGDLARLWVSVDQLREIHRKVTLQLAVITRQTA